MKSVIIGAGTYGAVYSAYLINDGVEIAAFLDDNEALWGKSIDNIPVLGSVGELRNMQKDYGVTAVYCSVGSNEIRVKILSKARELGYDTPNYIHPSVIISPNVSIADEGVYILAGTTIMPYVTIEQDVMISVGANIVHHSYLSQGTFISNGVNLGANIRTEPYVYIGMGATIMTGVHTLGKGCLIGAGSVVIRDVKEHAVMAGVPARLIKFM